MKDSFLKIWYVYDKKAYRDFSAKTGPLYASQPSMYSLFDAEVAITLGAAN